MVYEDEADDSNDDEGVTSNQLEENADCEDKLNGDVEDSDDGRHRTRKKVGRNSRFSIRFVNGLGSCCERSQGVRDCYRCWVQYSDAERKEEEHRQ